MADANDKTALAALVEAVEAAPVVVVSARIAEAIEFGSGRNFFGQRVRVLAVGEESND